MRALVNGALRRLPEPIARELAQELATRWASALFEIIAARVLQRLGGRELEREVRLASGKHVDFVGRIGRSTLGVEAVAPLFDRVTDAAIARDAPLVDLIERMLPAHAAVVVRHMPPIGLQETRRPLREALTAMIEQLPENLSSDWNEGTTLTREVAGGHDLKLTFVRRRPRGVAILAGPAYASYQDTVARIKAAVATKKRELRDAPWPVLIAVNGDFHAHRIDFDVALLGTETHVALGLGPSAAYRIEFRADGELGGSRAEHPNVAGVLAFVDARLSPLGLPIYYANPRFNGALPARIARLETRRVGGGGVVVIDAR